MSLNETLSNILDATISEDVMRNLQDEGITMKSLVFLTDADLKEIGFKMGERRLLLQWIRGHHSDSVPVESAGGHSQMETRTPPNLPSRIECNDLQDTPTTPTLRVQRLPCRFHISKDYPVETILAQQRQVHGTVSGSSLVQKLQGGSLPVHAERLFLVKVLGRYLMNNCSQQDRPTKGEKEDMARSIVKSFPVLKDATDSGHGSFFDGTSYTGTLEFYVRSRRSNCNDIETMWMHSPKSSMVPPESSTSIKESVRLLREQRPNIGNKQELLRLMDVTRGDRRIWLKHSSPSITETIRRYPRLLDMPDAVREEFRHITGTNKQLHIEWQQYKQLILNLSSSKCELESILSSITDDLDEDRKSEVAFKCLVYLLPTPQKRSVKRPKLSLESVLDRFFVNFEEDTVDNVVTIQEGKGVTQPMLIRVNNQYFVKVDNTAIALMDCCFAEAIEFLFMVFFVFQVEYPSELRVFYGFLEKMMDVKSTIKSSVLIDLLRTLKKMSQP